MRTDVGAAPCRNDTPEELAQPGGVVRDGKARGDSDGGTGRRAGGGECEPVPGVTMPRLVTVERDYPAVSQKMAALGPPGDTLGTTVKGITRGPDAAVAYLGRANGLVRGGAGGGR